MSFNFNLNGKSVKCKFTESQLCIEHAKTTESIDISDVVGVTTKAKQNVRKKSETVDLFVIKRLEKFIMKRRKLTFHSDRETCCQFEKSLQERLEALTERPKKLLVIISPPAGQQQGEKIYRKVVAPIFKLAGIFTEVVVSESATHIHEYMNAYDHSKIDGFVICGGDGSYNQMFVPLLERTQTEAGLDFNDSKCKLRPTPKPIGIIPTGTRNCSARISQGCTDPETAALHIVKGNKRQLPVVGIYSGNRCFRFCTIVIGFGLSTEMFYYTENFRWMKTMRYLLVPIYFFMVKTYPVFNAKIKIYLRSESDSEGHSVEGEIDPEKIVDVEGRYVDLLLYVHDFLNFGFNFTSDDYKFDNCEMNIYNTTYSSRFNVLKNFMMRMFNNTADYVNPPYIDNYKVSGFKVTVDMPVSSATEFPYRILADAEYVHLKEPEWELRFKGPVVTVYSSLPEKT